MLPSLTITNEQINSLPFLVGVLEDLGIRETIDAHVTPHRAWQGASVGTLVTIWLSHLLQERSHHLCAVRDWAAACAHTLNTLLGITLRDTDCTDDRLANVLTMLGAPTAQAALDTALVQQWLRVYRLPTQTLRLDSTSVSVYHDPDHPTSLLQAGHSKDHRPDLRQFKAMLATLDPLGLPLCSQLVAGNAPDDRLYVPAYTAAVRALGTTDLLVVGDSKMAALPTRGHLVAHGSCYLCTYRPPTATAEIAGWVEDALQQRGQWQTLSSTDPRTGTTRVVAEVHARTRPQAWTDPATGLRHAWTERVLLVRSAAYQAGLRARRERSLAKVSAELAKLWQPPTRGRKRYRTRDELERLVSTLIAEGGMTGVVHAAVGEESLPNGTTRWVVTRIWVDAAAWQALVARLGWQVYVTNTTEAQYDTPALVASYSQQVRHERNFSRLKTRNLQIRPVYLRDEQRIAGVLWLLTLALRVLTLTEHRVRAALDARQEAVVGLNPASRTQATARPTTERLISAFDHITLTTLQHADGVERHVTPLTATQRHILHLLDLPPDLYDRLTHPASNSPYNLRE